MSFSLVMVPYNAILSDMTSDAWLLVFWGTYERDDLPPTEEKVTLRDWASVFTNRPHRNFLGIFLGFQITVDLTLGIFIFYMVVVLLKYDYYELVVGVLLVSTVAFTPLMNLLAQRRGKVFPLFVGVPLWILASLVLLTVDAGTPVVVLCVLPW